MFNWQTIDTVFLDMDGTLLDLHFDTYFWLEYLPLHYASFHELDSADVKQELYELIMEQKGQLNWYCLDYWTEQLGVPIASLKREIADKIKIRPYVTAFLQALRRLDIRILIVTDAHPDSLILKMEKTGIQQQVDDIICSHDFGLPKENKQFWYKLHEKESFDKVTTLLVDDSLAVLQSAKSYGIANLLAISRPDSQQPARVINNFYAVEHFSEIIPDIKT